MTIVLAIQTVQGGLDRTARVGKHLDRMAETGLGPGDYIFTLVHDGWDRTYELHVPPGYSGDPVPLVVDFHGWGVNSTAQSNFSGFREKADQEGFLVAWPQGLGDVPSWNAGECCGFAQQNDIDDVGFAGAVVADVAARTAIDTSRVYATGQSNGGAITQRLGCEAADVFAGIAPVAYPLTDAVVADCQPARPIPVVHFHGINDPVVPYEGRGFFLGAEESHDAWADINACTDLEPERILTEGNSYCDAYVSCADDVINVLCTVNSSHGVYPNLDIDVPAVAWDLLSPYSLPASLQVRAVGPDFAWTDRPVAMVYRLENADRTLATELTGIRVTLTVDGAANFGTSALQGILVSGGGTNQVLVEFVEGLVELEINDPVEELVTLDGEDTEGLDIRFVSDLFEDFESDDGGFEVEGSALWEWGKPTSGPGVAFSGRRVWATDLDGDYPRLADSRLVSFSFGLPEVGSPTLWFRSWIDAHDSGISTYSYVELSQDDGASWTWLGIQQPSQIGYTLEAYDLSAYAGLDVRIRFRFASEPGASPRAGWYIDNFAVLGVRDPKQTLFLDPAADIDDDGLTNEEEVDLGTLTDDPDTDDDGVLDGTDNCPLDFNPDQSDDDGDGDGTADACDNCLGLSNENQEDYDYDGMGDACELGADLADANRSGRVDGFDLMLLGLAFGATCDDLHYNPAVDFHRDDGLCQVEGNDLAVLASEFAQSSSLMP
jgi:polyhydroxybutyrate depolymerase